MNEVDIISEGYRSLFGKREVQIIPMPRSGSDRKYFRIISDGKSVIGAYNPVREENDAFVGFTKHFIFQGLPVPEIFGYFPEKHIYFLQDLGDISLYSLLCNNQIINGFTAVTIDLYKRILDNLILFQTRGGEGLNFKLCYPHRSFDLQSMMWDLNYFKYMFLKLMTVPFSEQKLENDFICLCNFLLQQKMNYFLYRDFQSANIMIVKDEPWFIDYQGGRKGAPQYDVASILYDAKIPMESITRKKLLDYYIKHFCKTTGEESRKFREYYSGFCMIRLMQVLGAFGYRGLYENKPTFTESIVPGVLNLIDIIRMTEKHLNLPELYTVIRSVTKTEIFRKLESEPQIN
jgi:aminoglycoside/choline kinase family phosphotransferase